ncbi:hypothetical protein OAA49_00200 [Flavobacteriales bacterium]|nr:hypothetical protein [Flavobacteriales bacterium]
MKKIILFTISISLLSCGIKKDLAESQSLNNKLELQVKNLEKKQIEFKNQLQKINIENKKLR